MDITLLLSASLSLIDRPSLVHSRLTVAVQACTLGCRGPSKGQRVGPTLRASTTEGTTAVLPIVQGGGRRVAVGTIMYSTVQVLDESEMVSYVCCRQGMK